MSQLQAPTGQFLLVELEPGLHSSRISGIYHHIVLLPGVQSAADLALIPLEHLAERVLLRLEPGDLPREYRHGAYHQKKRQPPLL